jgi:type I restriction enzyme R subunit
MSTPPLEMRLFDPDSEVWVLERRLPHWSQPGAVTFVTWRTEDSMPKEVLDQWFDDRSRLLRSYGIDPSAADWQEHAAKINDPKLREGLHCLWNRWHDALDIGHGACVLRRSELADIVAKSLRHFDDQRYIMLDYVVMPNHVHLLAAFPDKRALLAQCESWKHFTAVQVNRRLGRKGRFWQQDAFDHLVRCEKQFRYLRDYSANNPVKAGLRPGEFAHYSKPLGEVKPSRSA